MEFILHFLAQEHHCRVIFGDNLHILIQHISEKPHPLFRKTSEHKLLHGCLIYTVFHKSERKFILYI